MKDKATAEALKPWRRRSRKRPTFNDEFLEAFNRPNVTLVDVSAARGVERITETGVVAGGQEYEVDCIIYATGFEIGTAIHRRFDFETIGEDGVSLFESWGNGMKTLHGHSTRGFPNWFYVGIGQNALSVNFTAMFDDQARHVAWIIHEAMARHARTVQPTAEAQEAWVAEIRRLSVMNRAFLEACSPATTTRRARSARARPAAWPASPTGRASTRSTPSSPPGARRATWRGWRSPPADRAGELFHSPASQVFTEHAPLGDARVVNPDRVGVLPRPTSPAHDQDMVPKVALGDGTGIGLIVVAPVNNRIPGGDSLADSLRRKVIEGDIPQAGEELQLGAKRPPVQVFHLRWERGYEHIRTFPI